MTGRPSVRGFAPAGEARSAQALSFAAVFLLSVAGCAPQVDGPVSTTRRQTQSGSGDGGAGELPPTMPPGPSTEICGNGLDDDGNGETDEGCTNCDIGTTRDCYPGDPAEVGRGECRSGSQSCEVFGEFGAWNAECAGAVTPVDEICGDMLDNNCNGETDEGCPTLVNVPVELTGDCLTVRCPAEAPFPVGCEITMDGGDPRGCVASTPTNSEAYFQEGDACGAGHLNGTLQCSNEAGEGLTEANCVINKETRYYPDSRGGCPATSG